MTDLTPELLRQLLRYEPDTGKLFWLPRPLSMCVDSRSCKSWNSKFSGMEAFTYRTHLGYYKGAVFNKLYLAHRVIWAMETGDWPQGELDHIDCNGGNNTWGNLRIATRGENIRNTRKRSDNTSGAKCVNWDAGRRKWKARIQIDGREIYLGRFTDFASADTAVRAARTAVHGVFARN